DRGQEVEPVGVGAEDVGDLGRGDAGELGLRHLLAADQEPAVREHALGHVDPRRHQHRRPDHRVEAQDVLADHMVGRPATGELLVVRAVPDRGGIVQQRVDPHVDDMRRVPRQRNAPVEGRARDREVFQPLRDERDHLVACGVGAHEVGLGLVELQQAVLELAELEEVVLLLQELQGLGVDRADLEPLEGTGAVDDLGLRLELLAPHAVQGLVLAGVDVARVIKPLEEDLHVPLV
ncbi:hypothetical protein ABE10_01900, partial [Bacillus toyonensis]|nr:hypothetical protein [Bacillus toyonensis]